MFTITMVSALSRAASFEIIEAEENMYYASCEYDVRLNGEEVYRGKTNVFSLHGLSPSTYYEIYVHMQNGSSAFYQFVTPRETILLDVTRFGAQGDGKTVCTDALQAAISVCPKGGTVVIPKGVYLSYPLFLKSDMLLYLEEGAVLLGGTERARYPVLPGTVAYGQHENSYASWEGDPSDSYASLLTMIGVQNTAVAGPGVIDGNAQNTDWWENVKVRRGAWRPRTIFCAHSQNITLLGVTVQNSPSWTIHPYYCEDIDVVDIKLINPPDSPNTDGCNPESCRNVRIIGADISVGDDCISVKSGKHYMASYHPKASENILVRNCLLQRGHGAVVVGSEISCGVHGLHVERCIFRKTDRGLRIKTRRGRGISSVVDAVWMRNIVMEDVLTPFVVNMFYFCDPDGHSEMVSSKKLQPVNELTPSIRRIHCENIAITGAGCAGCFFYGLPEKPIESVSMKNVSIRFAEDAKPGFPAMMDDIEKACGLGFFACNVERVYLENMSLWGTQGEPYQLQAVDSFMCKEC